MVVLFRWNSIIVSVSSISGCDLVSMCQVDICGWLVVCLGLRLWVILWLMFLGWMCERYISDVFVIIVISMNIVGKFQKQLSVLVSVVEKILLLWFQVLFFLSCEGRFCWLMMFSVRLVMVGLMMVLMILVLICDIVVIVKLGEISNNSEFVIISIELMLIISCLVCIVLVSVLVGVVVSMLVMLFSVMMQLMLFVVQLWFIRKMLRKGLSLLCILVRKKFSLESQVIEFVLVFI